MRHLAAVHLAATAALTGLIWFVQLVHYPLLVMVPAEVFPAYESAHILRTTPVVLALMLIEVATAIGLWASDNGAPRAAFIGILLLGIIWASTTSLQAPLHTYLQDGFSAELHTKLIVSNWIRTIAWSARCGLAIFLCNATDGGKTAALRLALRESRA